jgi:Flp pilus assembly protein TadG
MRRLDARREGGQALTEFAIVLPIFLLIVFAAIDLGRVIWAADSLANAAREGARFASVHGDAEIVTAATKADIRDETLSYLVAAGTNRTVTVCYSAVAFASSTVGCSGDTDEIGALNTRGNLVTVVATADVSLLTGSLLGLPGFTVRGASTALINN